MTKECDRCRGAGIRDYICEYCNGSGEGMRAGSKCTVCHGMGGYTSTCEICLGGGTVETCDID